MWQRRLIFANITQLKFPRSEKSLNGFCDDFILSKSVKSDKTSVKL